MTPHPVHLKKSPNLAITVPSTFTAALCKRHDETLFYSFTRGEDRAAYNRRLSAAQQICKQCPVYIACQDEARALPAGSRFGIWAGRDVHLHPHMNLVAQRQHARNGFH